MPRARGPRPWARGNLSVVGKTSSPRVSVTFHVHGESRREVGAKEGDRVTLVLSPDLEPAGTEPPPDLADALRELDVLDSFRAMGPAVRRELVACGCLPWPPFGCHRS
jgi:hypothetical protein